LPDLHSLPEAAVSPVTHCMLPGEKPTVPVPREVRLYTHISGSSAKS